MAMFKIPPSCVGQQRFIGEKPRNPRLSEANPFVANNKLAAAENLSTHANNKRLQALVRGWETRRRMQNGEKVVTFRQKRALIKRKRLRLKVTVAKEAAEIQEIARTHASAALERLAKIIESENSQDSTAVQAIAVMLDRAYGKANQTNVNTNVNIDGKANELTPAQLDERVTKALKRVEDLTRGTPKTPESPQRPSDIRKLN